MFTLTFFAFLRIGEMTKSPHSLHWKDCQIFPIYMLISFRSFKFSHGFFPHILIPRSDNNLCPVYHCTQYLAVHPSLKCSHFSPCLLELSARFYIRLVYLLVLTIFIQLPVAFALGIPIALGIPADVIQWMGRWSSAAFLHYVRVHLVSIR